MAYFFHGNPMKTLFSMATNRFHKLLENICHHNNSFSFDWMFLKLVDKVDMDYISDKFKNWLDRIINLRFTSS